MKLGGTYTPKPTGSRTFLFQFFSFFNFRRLFEQTPPRGFVTWPSNFCWLFRTWNLRKVVLFATLRQRAWLCQSRPYSIMSSFLPLYLNSSQRICPFGFKIGHYTQDNLWLYVKGRGHGVTSKLAIFHSVVFFPDVWELTPPRDFLRSASKSVSTDRRWCWTNVVLFATLRRRAWPWRAVKVGSVVFFSQSLWTNSPQGIHQFCFKISQYSQNTVQTKRCALCDSTSKGVSVACRQSWPFFIQWYFFHCMWTNSS